MFLQEILQFSAHSLFHAAGSGYLNVVLLVLGFSSTLVK